MSAQHFVNAVETLETEDLSTDGDIIAMMTGDDNTAIDEDTDDDTCIEVDSSNIPTNYTNIKAIPRGCTAAKLPLIVQVLKILAGWYRKLKKN